MTLDLRITAVAGVVRLVIEGLGAEAEDAIWDAHDEAGGLVRCTAVNRATGYRRSMQSRGASTSPLELEFFVDAHSMEAADAVHLSIPDHGIDATVPLPLPRRRR